MQNKQQRKKWKKHTGRHLYFYEKRLNKGAPSIAVSRHSHLREKKPRIRRGNWQPRDWHAPVPPSVGSRRPFSGGECRNIPSPHASGRARIGATEFSSLSFAIFSLPLSSALVLFRIPWVMPRSDESDFTPYIGWMYSCSLSKRVSRDIVCFFIFINIYLLLVYRLFAWLRLPARCFGFRLR